MDERLQMRMVLEEVNKREDFVLAPELDPSKQNAVTARKELATCEGKVA